MTFESIESNVGRSPGAYMLLDPKNKTLYVGRSDDDLKAQLSIQLSVSQIDRTSWLSSDIRVFFEHTNSKKEAFNLECIWYHQCAPPHNPTHPQKSNPRWKCLSCGF